MRNAFYLLPLFLLLSCSEEKPEEEVVKTESMPSVDLQQYDTIHFLNQFQFLVPKEFSVSTKTIRDSRLCYSDLVHEEHVFVFSTRKSDYRESIELRSIEVSSDSLFINYADEQFNAYRSTMTKTDLQEEYLSMVKERQTKYFRFTGRSYGFPLEKSVSLRFYEGRGEYYTILYWTLASDHEKFETKEDVIMMSFDEIKKGQPES